MSPKLSDGSFVTIRPGIALMLLAWLTLAPTSALGQPAVKGEWSAPFATQNVMIHAHGLPNGKVLFWSRREGESLDEHFCIPRIWDPESKTITETPNLCFNLFCSGHTFLPDGRLFAVGGHISDFHGSPHAAIYDPNADTWTLIHDTKGGRW